MTEYLPCVEQAPAGDAKTAVIWLHGLGADGHDFAPIPPELGLDPDLAVRFVFPHAPRIPVTINMGMVMPAWYDIRSFDERGQDEPGLRRSSDQIEALIEREVERGVPSHRIVLAGFSQGAALSLFTGLRYPQRLAGLMPLSGYLPLADKVFAESSAENRPTPIFQAHGSHDPVVPVQLGAMTRDKLLTQGYSVTWRDYPMEHQVCPQEIQDIGSWLGEVLAAGLASEEA
ncbi:MAG: carboxylesterase [Acidobacteriota bacterium]